MLKTIRTTSLRTRLALLAAFAVVALIVALFVAWRLARATESFALRQADSSVHGAARDLARELQSNPDGYQTIEQAMPGPVASRRQNGPRGEHERSRPTPPHVEQLFAAYSDPFTRLGAITLHRFPGVEGGFYRSSDATLIGYAFTDGSDREQADKVPAEFVDMIRAVANEAVASGAPASRTTQVGNYRVLLVAYPAQGNDIGAAWAMQRLSNLSGVSDWPNLAALLALAFSILAVTSLALVTVRDLRSGVAGIELGLAGLTTDLDCSVAPPDTLELARIATAINELAGSLRINIARQVELEQQLAQRERLSALGRVVAGVAHEVRNPLAAIKLKVQLARRASYAREKLDETFNVVTAEIERLDTLVRRLLELGDQQKLEHAPVDLGELVSRRAAFFTDLATRENVVIDLQATAGTIIEGDENRLGQVVDNLIQNALDAMSDGGRLTITCETFKDPDDATSARLKFDDTGPGIQQSDQEHIFEPFHTGRDSGTGLGLPIARAIVEEHGGRLRFVSSDGNGASFVIELPLAISEAKVNYEPSAK